MLFKKAIYKQEDNIEKDVGEEHCSFIHWTTY
jgi:hypothetical protein